MALNSTLAFRVRAGGNNLNGGGCDTGYSGSSVTPAATGSHGSIVGNVFTDATAAAFTTAMVGHAIFIGGIGQFTIASRQSASQVTFAEPLTGFYAVTTTMGGLSWAVGPGIDYSQQTAAQVSGSAGTATGTGAFSDAAATFTANMVGNTINIASGTGFTPGIYTMIGFSSTHAITLDRSPGTGTAAVWKLGGAWLDQSNFQNGVAQYVGPGNYVYFLGSGLPVAPYSGGYDFTFSAGSMQASGDVTNGYVNFTGDPNTPGGGLPLFLLTNDVFWNSSSFGNLWNFWVVAGDSRSNGVFHDGVVNIGIWNFIYDANGYDTPFINGSHLLNGGPGVEVTSSVAARGTNAQIAVNPDQGYGSVYLTGWNIHDTIGPGLAAGGRVFVDETVVSKCGGDAVTLNQFNQEAGYLKNCTIDGNTGKAIVTTFVNVLACVRVYNNIISNHSGTAVDASGTAQTLAQNDQIKLQVDYNSFYNNGTNYNGLSPGPNDRQLLSSPVPGESVNNWNPASAIYSTGSPQAALAQYIPGWNG